MWLESAFFTPLSAAGVARKYGLSTDASYRFERGVDPMMVEQALERATYWLQEIAGGVAGPVVKVQQPGAWGTPKEISFRPSQVVKKIGLEIPEAEMRQIFSALALEILSETTVEPLRWQIRIPSHRFDLTIEEDLIEEVTRVYGYEHLPAAALKVEMRVGHIDPMERLAQQISTHFAALGYRQTVSYSFVDPAVQQALFPGRKGLALVNPLSEELSEMRVSLWPGLLASMLYNINRQQQHVALFECGRVFLSQEMATSQAGLETGEGSDRACLEVAMVGGILTGTPPIHWEGGARRWNFYDLKGVVEALFERQAIPVVFEARMHDALHPGKSAALILAGACVGWCGVLHPRLAQVLDIETEVMLFECRLDAWSAVQAASYRSISKFPQVRRDLALLVDESVSFAEIERVIYSVAQVSWFKKLEVFDIYKGTGIPTGKKSVAVALWMQSHEGTLLDEDMNAWIQQVVQTLQDELSIILRDGAA